MMLTMSTRYRSLWINGKPRRLIASVPYGIVPVCQLRNELSYIGTNTKPEARMFSRSGGKLLDTKKKRITSLAVSCQMGDHNPFLTYSIGDCVQQTPPFKTIMRERWKSYFSSTKMSQTLARTLTSI
jgi:hypothetical protein